MTTLAELRSRFLDFFAQNGHTIVPSSSLVPANDPTLLFTNAGMVQFKDVFLGLEKRPYTRAASSQRCVRAGGKHNDLENVGYTARHHTFFEMLGNFSFGDYFKEGAIEYAWRFLTEDLRLPPERLWITVHVDDDEAARIWLEKIGVDPARFSRIAGSDNFWQMGDTGPCGPCSEIFYDHGPAVPGGPPGSAEADGDRYVEIWNLVFMQYNRSADGRLDPLPKPSVDTGMGLERLAAVMQGVHSNYDIDLFRGLIRAAAEVTGASDLTDPSLKVIADHIRSSAFLVADGVLPANEGRGYVLRRIIRRAIRHGHKLGCRRPFFHRLVAPLGEWMGDAYPELRRDEARIAAVLEQEEARFAQTLEQGMALLEEAIAALPGKTLPGELVFKLYDTYGFPVDLTADIARERGLALDMAGYEACMAEQRRRAQAAGRFKVDLSRTPAIDGASEFRGYEELSVEARVLHLLRDGEPVEHLEAGQEGVVVLDRTPFYPEGGGQVGDRGRIAAEGAEFEVQDTQPLADAILHIGVLRRGRLGRGDTVRAEVDAERRRAIVRNHSATHLLHAALRRVLGEHVQQKGSLVDEDRLRFDFSHDRPLGDEDKRRIETLVNDWILDNVPAQAEYMSMEEARRAGAIALFGEKYGERVRVMSLGEVSKELCGGTHVRRTGDIGLFKIVAEGGVAAGVRRIEAITGRAALRWAQDAEALLQRLDALLKAGGVERLEARAAALLERQRDLEKQVDTLKRRLAGRAGRDLAAEAVDVDGVKVVAARLEGADAKTLREAVDGLRNRLQRAVVVLAAVEDGKVRLAAGVTPGLSDTVRAGELVNAVAQQVGGRGGGRADFAQAGGTDPAGLDAALAGVVDWVRAKLAG
ncbi:MAG: alanine--tRNA ligase [Gammaproteobacteria bacterium]|nr:MAG: alanine--tRNA ligase [Gammaproteobacteria bacterium]